MCGDERRPPAFNPLVNLVRVRCCVVLFGVYIWQMYPERRWQGRAEERSRLDRERRFKYGNRLMASASPFELFVGGDVFRHFQARKLIHEILVVASI